MVYVPWRIGGIGYLHLYYVQIYLQVYLAISLLRTSSELSTLFRINLEIFAFELDFLNAHFLLHKTLTSYHMTGLYLPATS